MAPYQPPAELSLAKMDAAWSRLTTEEGARRKAINDKIQSIRESLRVRYSELANGFENELNGITQALAASEGSLESQMATLKSLNERMHQVENSFPEIKAADALCNEAGVDESDRDYTVYGVDDLQFDFSLVQNALQKKAAFLENQMVAQKMTNLTPQQIEEFEATFRAFDKQQSNTLSKLEFKACVESLGNLLEDQEVDETFNKVSQNTEYVTFEQFTNFMVSITEDKTTPEQLRQSFLVISQNKDHVTETDLRTGQLPPEQIEYLKRVLPKFESKPDAYDFQCYLAQMFGK
jgi:Ca2+-binding EF-hand superfamily protein